MDVFAATIVGIIIGVLASYIVIKSRKASGTFIIDWRDPMNDTFRLEMDDDLNLIYSKKQIILNVKILEDHSLK